jgi:uncharacterized membrane protein
MAVSSGSKKSGLARNGWVVSLILFGLFVLFVFMIMIAWAPYCLVSRKKYGSSKNDDCKKRSWRRSHLDYGRLFLWSLLVAVVAVFLFWLLSAITGGLVAAVWGGRKSKNLY